MKRYYRAIVVVFVVAMIGVAALGKNAYAHVLVRDQSGKMGAVLHIMPDDDPIAGVPATIYLDRQNNAGQANVTLTIRSDGDSEDVPVDVQQSGPLVTATHTFPSQGVYRLQYRVVDQAGTYLFDETVRVSRGARAGADKTTRHTWAEGGLIACGVATLALGIVALNRRKGIAQHSTF